MMRLALALLPLLLTGAAPAMQDDGWTAQRAEWNQPQEPFRVAGNVYYVGTAGLSSFLIVDPGGMILIDGGLPESAPLILANIRKLGFDPRHVRFLLINHAHFDHAGGLAELKRETGARLLASEGDRHDLERGRTLGRADLLGFPTVRVDGPISEGQHIRLGATDLVAHLTPGHTRGCTSWTLRVMEQGRSLTVLFACSLTVAGRILTPAAEREFAGTFAALRAMRADIYLSFHPGSFGMADKRARQVAGDPLAFVDPAELPRRLDAAEHGVREELAKQQARQKR